MDKRQGHTNNVVVPNWTNPLPESYQPEDSGWRVENPYWYCQFLIDVHNEENELIFSYLTIDVWLVRHIW